MVEGFAKELRTRKAKYEEHKDGEEEEKYARWWAWVWRVVQKVFRKYGYNAEPL